MGKTLTTTCKMCRREGVSLCGRENCALKKRAYPPGMHGPKFARRKPRLSSYGIQLREKQKAKRLYNILEKPFLNYFKEATAKQGNSAETLIQFLELRLDNVVYRLGFAKTRRQARQMVGHRFFDVNGATVDIPSYRVRVGDVIRIRENKRKKGIVEGLSERVQNAEVPKWLSADPADLSGKVTTMPEQEDVEKIFDSKLIVEFYSR